LKSLSAAQYAAFRETILALIKADNSLSLFEFVVQRTLLVQLDRHFTAAPPPVVRYWSWQAPIRDHAACVLSALSYVGQSTDDAAGAVFAAAWQHIDPSGSAAATPLASCTLSAIGSSLDQLTSAAPPLKKQLIAAAVVAVSQDGTITASEAELLRAVADSLDCPLPPLHVGAVTMAEAEPQSTPEPL
jgi:hypothetical protein